MEYVITSSDTHNRTINIYVHVMLCFVMLHVNQPWVSDDIVIDVWLNIVCPCVVDTGPLNLIDAAFPRLGTLQNGVSVVYDVTSHVHALQFLPDAKDVTFPVTSVFQSCQYFPEEFSIFFIFKHNVTQTKQCLFSISNAEKQTLLSVCLSKKKVIFTFNNERTRFRSSQLTSNVWHTVGFSVTGSHVTMTSDCLHVRRHRLHRTFPSYLELTGTAMYIAGCVNCQMAFTVSFSLITYSFIYYYLLSINVSIVTLYMTSDTLTTAGKHVTSNNACARTCSQRNTKDSVF